LVTVAAATVPARMQTPADSAKVADVNGKAQRRTSRNPDQWVALKIGDLVAVDSAVQTDANSAVLLSLPGQHVIRIGESTTLELEQLGKNSAYSFSLLKGRIWSFVDKASKPAKYEVETASVILGVSGTLFSVSRDEESDEFESSVQEGKVRLRRGQVSKTLEPGFQLRVVNRRLGAAVPRKHTIATLAMWKSVGGAESWHKRGGALKLDRQVDERARAIVQERQRERAAAGRGRSGGRGTGRGRGRGN
jgi:hypothetical protein